MAIHPNKGPDVTGDNNAKNGGDISSKKLIILAFSSGANLESYR